MPEVHPWNTADVGIGGSPIVVCFGSITAMTMLRPLCVYLMEAENDKEAIFSLKRLLGALPEVPIQGLRVLAE
jgi:hypothetical protein